jgi:hypothetical protein
MAAGACSEMCRADQRNGDCRLVRISCLVTWFRWWSAVARVHGLVDQHAHALSHGTKCRAPSGKCRGWQRGRTHDADTLPRRMAALKLASKAAAASMRFRSSPASA